MVKSVKYFALTLILLGVSGLFAQQEPLTRMFWRNYSVVNPANSGFEYKQNYGALYRDQWTGSAGSPKTFWLMADVFLESIHSGVGINYMYDEVANFRTNRFSLNYNYQFELGKDHFLSIGVGIALNRKGILDSWILYPMSPNIDPAIPENLKPMYAMGLNGGLNYRFKNLSLGVSMININQPKFKHDGDYYKFEYPAYRHLYAKANYKIQIGQNWAVTPSMYLIASEQESILDANLRVIFKDTYFIGASFNENESIAFQAGFKILKKISIAYSYDNTPTLSKYQHSHELGLNFSIDK